MSDVIYTDHGSPQAIGLNFLIAGDGPSMWSVYLLHPPGVDPLCQRSGDLSLSLESLGRCLDADFSLLRLTRPWSIDDYSIGIEAVSDIRTASRAALRRHVRARRTALEALGAHTVDVFLAVRLPDRGERNAGSGGPWLIDTEVAVFAGVLDCAPARRVRREELSRLVRTASGKTTGTQYRACLQVTELPPTRSNLERGVDSFFAQLAAMEFAIDAALTAGLDCDRPPRWAASLSLSLSAADRTELHRRMDHVRSELQGFTLRTAESSDPDLVRRHLRPACTGSGRNREGLKVARLGSISLSTAALGSRAGAYVGRTVAGARGPVLFDPFEPGSNGSSSLTLITGGAGAGKTVCMQLIMYNAFIAGAAVIDIDLGGAHTLERVPEVGERIDILELSAVKRFRGLLDPLRIGRAEARERLACDFLLGVLPPPIPAAWHTEIARAVNVVALRNGTSCCEAVAELKRGTAISRAAAREIEANVMRGLPVLGYGQSEVPTCEHLPQPITSLRLRHPSLRVSSGGDPREKQIRDVIVRLVGAYALHLADMHHNSTCVVGLDDASSFVTDAAGRAVVDELVTRGQSGQFASLIAARKPKDVAWLVRRSGAVLCFGSNGEDDSRRISRILYPAIREDYQAHRMMESQPGCCIMRDRRGRVGVVQIELADQGLRAALDTTSARS
jgi:hypothetical protein